MYIPYIIFLEKQMTVIYEVMGREGERERDRKRRGGGRLCMHQRGRSWARSFKPGLPKRRGRWYGHGQLLQKHTHSESDHDPLGDRFSIGIVAVLGGR